MQFLNPGNWPKPKGYANGVVANGRQIFVAGQVGWNASEEFETDDFCAQLEQALQNTIAVLAEAGAEARHIVRMVWYITDKRDYTDNLTQVGAIYRQILGKHFPAMTLVQVAGLLQDQAKIEVETTAVMPTAG